MIDYNWKVSKGEAIKILIISCIIIIFIIWQMHREVTPAQLVLTAATKNQFHGKVESVFRDERDHNMLKVKLTTGYVYSLYPEWESMVELGDSLSKLKNTVVVEVFKQNGKKVILDYKELVKDFKK
ncbi:hypothetical protein [Mucilaginibacter sp.]|uniref:hypothetical protein n=1 Tax=Mucilaginibacter sp. TaxID=1882438 RepID=UPI0025EF7103|nr:hypothetical protein [Mucilaginibacter sp.]